MKRKNSIYYLLWSLIIFSMAGLFPACTSEEDIDDGGGGGENSEGTGYFSLQIKLDEAVETKAEAGKSAGIPEESYFDGLRLILYSSSGQAIKCLDYPVRYSSRGFEPGASGVTFGDTALTIPVIDLERKPYRMVAILNYSDVSLARLQGAGYSGTDYAAKMSAVSHNISLFAEPVNLFEAFGGDALKAVKGADFFFWGDPSDALYPDEYTVNELSAARFFMTNSKGPLDIHPEDIKPTPEEAEKAANRKVIPVERAVAKVGLFKGATITPDGTSGYGQPIYKVLNGGHISDITWCADVINLRTCLMRQPAPVAPVQGDTMETEYTDSYYRYAMDPNYEGISLGNPASTGGEEPDHHFFYVPAATYYTYLKRNWITDDPSGNTDALDKNNKMKYEYVTENTMAADEQYGDVTTRVVLKCQYAPEGFTIGQSYYYFRGHAFTHAQIMQYRANPSLIPVSENPELEGLAQVLADLEVINTFWPDTNTPVGPITRTVDPNNPSGEPTKSITLKELSYYKKGETYYSIPIRHFKDAESPDLMGYGRYGVVRNNVYRVVVDDIHGPGYISFPEPEGQDDVDNKIESSCLVSPWYVKNLHFDF